ncbi:hypothetical protein GGE16_004683 [Rhizobium leguminosarum]|uniref:Uncharacterized protein n=1 Tax=Rhizobium leguminosarum TaxID=384 RepID=A0AAE2SZK0_RHILE|nr:hypothetical protein [Rhizobium leguminosarum]MBB4434446.1 hypothetical protein [Rhizobium esperanzae]MBB4298843.1 hypothetical protein [Rhizobium leguminosarum]MBB4310184.1 hypothetical protein [Rhizobium leguminosarum]MBB4531342.1 hypothetical protein [Rhizobium leguminosarum]
MNLLPATGRKQFIHLSLYARVQSVFTGTLLPYSFHHAVNASIVGPRPRAFLRDLIFDARGNLGKDGAEYQAVCFELAQLRRQHVLGDAGNLTSPKR